ncbi:hypothetical protein TSOC_003711 [Tetrabaena socialis]|uniref:C2 domain-containing protein n=1 Tax=Tetrabaena socialis TaxID=47790 RepID=A0A2J8AAZ0_9CHLO|nr:hypothetical protein TSOC_003711 [Tetrabaena socialis]|eukprot:PNH09633.1 hypothetical protein TSOC_003711 [Tetrabaena socialis]
MAGKLCISVIEARNVQADDYAEKNFYVKLRVGNNEVKTDIVKGSVQPKFLKDCRLAVPSPESDGLRIELLQVGPRGDLVVGSDDLRVLSITARGTIVHWFQLKTASRSVSAELCLVLRYLSAEANRPMSPTYAMAARQAKERALESPTTPTGPSKSAFRDMPATSPKPAVIAASPAPAPSSPQPLPRAKVHAASPVASTSAPAAAPQTVPARPAKEARRAGRARATQVPLPFAILGGMVAGALMYLWKRRPVYYEVQEDDTLCHIASCFKKRVEDVYARNRDVLKNPSRLYPGDRLRIR